MAEAFRGEFYQKIDTKARVSIPAPFRRVLEREDDSFAAGNRPRVILVYGGANRCFLEGYSIIGMAEIEGRIRHMPIGTPQRRYLEHHLITLSLCAEIDEEGRIVVAQKLREKMQFSPDQLKSGGDVVFAGTLDRFQIWRSADYEAHLAAQTMLALDVLPEGGDMLSLLSLG